jgi:L-fuconolactonase
MSSAATGTATSSHLPVRQDWLDRRLEEIIEPDLPIVDPHHHLVERPETGRYLLPELLADLGSGHNITATVYLEWLSMYRVAGPAELRPVGEIEFANSVAAMAASGTYGKPQVCAGIVGYADLTLAAPVEKVLEAMIAAGGGRFRGIRFITATHPDQAAWGSLVSRPAGLLMDGRVREGFARLALLGLSFDAWMYHTQLGELVDLARAFPDTPIVLDHVGGAIGLGPYAGKRDEVFAEWSSRIRGLAACPNVHVKLGGLGMRMFGFAVHTGELPPSSEELAAAWRRISRVASPPSAPNARCSKATSRSTKAAAATPRCGTPSNASPPGSPSPKKQRSSPARRSSFTSWDRWAPTQECDSVLIGRARYRQASLRGSRAHSPKLRSHKVPDRAPIADRSPRRRREASSASSLAVH